MNLFDTLIESILNENANVAGGPDSVLGSGVTSTASQFSADTYASNDARVVKPLGGIVRRNFPKDSIYTSKTRNKRTKRGHKRSKSKR